MLHALKILGAELPGLEVSHGDPLRLHVPLLFKVVEFVAWNVEFAQDFRRFHVSAPMMDTGPGESRFKFRFIFL
jgi:hypothetical protein